MPAGWEIEPEHVADLRAGRQQAVAHQCRIGVRLAQPPCAHAGRSGSGAPRSRCRAPGQTEAPGLPSANANGDRRTAGPCRVPPAASPDVEPVSESSHGDQRGRRGWVKPRSSCGGGGHGRRRCARRRSSRAPTRARGGPCACQDLTCVVPTSTPRSRNSVLVRWICLLTPRQHRGTVGRRRAAPRGRPARRSRPHPRRASPRPGRDVAAGRSSRAWTSSTTKGLVT